MANPVAKQMMRSRNPRTRELGRRLARGNAPHISEQLSYAMDIAARIAKTQRRLLKDGASAGAGAATSADTGFTPTYGSVPRARRQITHDDA